MSESSANLGGVGESLPRLDALEKASGQAKYIADLYRPGMLYGAILASPLPHARIRSYHTDAARALPGVAAVVTGEDVGPGRMGAFIKDEPAIAQGKVRYTGEPVAAVAAESEAIARQAAALIEVDYEALPALATPREALGSNTLIHEDLDAYIKVFPALCSGNVASETEFLEGDPERGFAESDLVVEGRFQTPAQAHVPLEPCGALAEIDPDGRVTLWSANQSVFRVQANVCESLGLPMSRLRCLTPKVGGGFGNKMEPHIQPITVALALAAGRPVKLILSREEDFQMVRARHPYEIHCKTGVRRDGTLLAREIEVLVDCGAYGDDSPGVLGYSLLMARGPYRIPHTRCHGRLVYTNKLRFGAFRGFGNPQVTFATETQLDEIAEALDLDPIELRLKNALREGEPWLGGTEVASNGFVECVEQVREASGWERRSTERSPSSSPRRALGVACTAHICGLLASGAIVRVLEDGSVVLNTGTTDIGQGSDTILTQMCAETLQVPAERVRLASPDTDGSPYSWGTTASRITYTTGRAVVAATQDVVSQLKNHASEMLEVAPADLELRPGGRIGAVGTDQLEVSFHEISLRAHWRTGGPIVGTHTWVFNRPTVDPKRAVARGLPFPQIGVFSLGCVAVDAEIDEVTGSTTVREAWSAVDVGKAINPVSVEGQIEGAFVQGLGYALCEELVWEELRLANPTLMDYKIPTCLDAPHRIHPILVEHAEPEGPFGAKGVGEIGINAVAPAIANAIASATGARLRHLPLTPERVLRGILESDDEA